MVAQLSPGRGLTLSSLCPQALTMPQVASAAVLCARHHKMVINHLWFLLSSCSLKL